jgi:hypothetical protein
MSPSIFCTTKVPYLDRAFMAWRIWQADRQLYPVMSAKKISGWQVLAQASRRERD